MDSPKVYVILINYKNWQDTVECLESLLKSTYANFKVVVVDNHSQNHSITHLKDWSLGNLPIPLDEQFYTKASISTWPVDKPVPFLHSCYPETLSQKINNDPRLFLIESQTNLGFAGGNNVGIKLALGDNADYIWLLNNDTVVKNDTLLQLVTHAEVARQHDIKLGILGSKLLYYHNPHKIQALLGRYRPATASTEHIGLNYDEGDYPSSLSIAQDDYVVGASMFVPASFIKEVGLMSEEYFLYFEELDWVKRGQKYGYTIDVCTKSKVYHKEGASIGGSIKDNNNKSELSDFYSIRNRIIITKKYYRRYLPSVYLSLIFVIINRIKRGQYSRLPLILKIILNSFKQP